MIQTRHGRPVKAITYADSDGSDFDERPKRKTTRAAGRDSLGGFVEDDERPAKAAAQATSRAGRAARRGAVIKSSDEEYRGDEAEDDDDGSHELEDDDDVLVHSDTVSPPPRRAAVGRGGRGRAAALSDDDSQIQPRNLRARNRVNYTLPPPIDDIPKRSRFGVLGGNGGGGGTPSRNQARMGGAGMNGDFLMNMGLGMMGDPTAGYGHLPDSDSVSRARSEPSASLTGYAG